MQKKLIMTRDISKNIAILKESFDKCSDVFFVDINLNNIQHTKAVIVFADTLCERQLVNNLLLEPIMKGLSMLPREDQNSVNELADIILGRLLSNINTKKETEINNVINFILLGYAALFIDGCPYAIISAVHGMDYRPVEEASTEPNMRGPRDGFVENLSTNVSLIRRRIRSSELKIELMDIGKLTMTRVAFCYINGIINEDVIIEAKERLKKIETDSILASGYIEEFIMDEKVCLFPLIQDTERPDRVVAALLEGKFSIIVDNSPSVLIAPCTFVSFLHSADDHYTLSPFATFNRVLRLIGIFIAIFLPAITVAIFSYNPEIIPTALLTSISGSRQHLPFPIVVEVLFMELNYELLREAGLRMPRTIGQTISTVGGLVIGQAVVTAGLVSPISGIVVAITAIASFTMPNFSMATSFRILRFFFIIVGILMGSVGIVIVFMMGLGYLCSLRSFGVPYFSPLAPLSINGLKDSILRVPRWLMKKRPNLMSKRNPARQGDNQGPKKPEGEGEENK